ncbi:MAG: D-Ala-D-Ala carboxypeptidase family metallohydrolase [Leptolyngbya sp.]|nr:D-Ala-D-Ala carboxypeptidase family metallohydrolase [Leptolyngbya sp.]
MGTWVKQTDQAIYLMSGNTYLEVIPKRPSTTNPKEKVANISAMQGWFARGDRPRGMTFAVGTGDPEPQPTPLPPGPGEGLLIPDNNQIIVTSDTFFKIRPVQSSGLTSSEKVSVRRGTQLALRYYTDDGSDHWRVELADPLGDGSRTLWYVYTLHARLGTEAILTVTHDTLFKQEPKPSTSLPAEAKVLVAEAQTFPLKSFRPAADNHTLVELADTTLGPTNDSLWYVYNLHASASTDGSEIPRPHDGLQVQTVRDTVFTLRPEAPESLPESQQVAVPKGQVLNIQYYIDQGSDRWFIDLVKPELGDGQQTQWYVNTQDTKLISNITLTAVTNTIFKTEPISSSELAPEDKVEIPANTQFSLIGHLPAAGNHAKVRLADTTMGEDEIDTWYVYNPHVQIVGQRQLLQVRGDTIFKTSPALSSDLPETDKVLVKSNTVLEVSSYAQPEKNHVRVAFKGAFLGAQNRNTWYCYVPDIYIIGTEIGNNPTDQAPPPPPPSGNRGIPLQFPGFTGTYYSNDPIYWTTQDGGRGNFTWGEALHVNASTGQYRRPTSSEVIYGILRIAQALEAIRKRYGKPIIINSWYRDPATNAAVGGASQSRHLLGDGVDFVVSGRHPYDVYADLDRWWGNQGGLASSRSFTHIDARGYRARWNYDGTGPAKEDM